MKTQRTSLLFVGVMSLGIVAAPVMAQSTSADHSTMAHDTQAPPETSNQPGTDTWITTKVKSDLLASKGVSGTDVSVETKDGVVWLSGHAATRAEKDRAVTKAKAIEGVKKVEADKLVVGGKM
ncbi:BON domain-containing protein [Pseudoxanthomonas sp.]|uniref:BON domain-containing protein n=1 Tax=Pseudoxanthomonas sp. TaxID=1871049 RepID=UPI00260FE782|nr:BON domain-containing protein [Pseudoxanthomonas sp.]WDS35181.1 MAG: BON domain-containing protein [Pseudoxanthomonas sp.]